MAYWMRYYVQNKWLYALLIPGFVYLLVFKYIPMFGIVIAFKDLSLTRGIWGSEWVGFENFTYLFQARDFYKILRNSLILSFYQILWGFPAPIVLALMLNEVRQLVFKRVAQTLFYLPHFISWVVLTGIIINFLSPSTGLFNFIIKAWGGESIHFLLKPEYFRTIIVSAEIWKSVGWGTIIYLAAITAVDPALYESATMDGANRLQKIRYITLPGISSTIVILLVLNLGHILDNGFEQVYLLYNPLTYEVADVFETYTYRIGLQDGRISYAAAVGLFKAVIGFLLILGANQIARMFGEKSIW
jgi:putative aldouronate transport system permease protein